ncbi:heterokaryon incompatibility protein 6, or allele [Acrodontium crateriforme]|uniref:Heterokaryon incompatibility protein 6, or allele n=1 Tax=Acrodontium crateriforme TaxID=150365 RepID=A0AAQ3MAF6_9PEZI|nr:heterokaryon incompatibility protein 6, or allele [Acrodontium crateriforme]
MRTYSYAPLQGDEIRLLQLQAGDVDGDLHGRVHRFRLPEDLDDNGHGVVLTTEKNTATTATAPDSFISTAPQYSALSYTWGDPRELFYIYILDDGDLSQLPIKQNLCDALKRLRQNIPPQGSMLLWVDAISINQDDIPEKNAQIQKMAMIYNRAESVCVWLGREDKDSTRAVEFVDRLLKLEDFDPLTEDPGTPVEWAALHNLMQRPWFQRRWVVQEISLARKATLFCGAQSVSWPNFAAAAALFVARYRDLRHLFQSSKEFHNHPNYLGEVEALGAKSLVDITTNLFRKSDDGIVLERLMSLEALVSTLTLFEAGSPHDTIYAVLWLAHDAEPDAKESAALSFDPLVRTPTQSPEIDVNASQFDDTQRPFGESQRHYGYGESQKPYGDIVQSPHAISPISSPTEGYFKVPAPPPGRNRRDTFLKPPRRPTPKKTARSASDVSKMMAETHFETRPHFITVDYDLDIYEVYRQFLDFAMHRSRLLDIICHPWAPEPPKNEDPLPTWIPQLSSAPFEKRPGQNSYVRVSADSLIGTPGLGPRNYNASGKTKMYPAKGFIQGRTLITTGFMIDSIGVKKSAAVDGVVPGSWLDLVNWSGPPEPVPDRFWRTLVADRGPGGQKYPPAYFPLACKWVFEQRSRRGNVNTSELLTHGKCPSIATEFLRRVQSVVWDRMLVLTQGKKGSKKLLALVPAEAEEGDVICILYGCSVPVVLRRQRKRKAAHAFESPHISTRTESSLSSSAYAESSSSSISKLPAPHISLSRASSNTNLSESDTADSNSQPHPQLNHLCPNRDSSVGQGLQQGEMNDLPTLSISLESQHRYAFVGPCYVHGMMAGEGFKHQKDHGNKLRAFHLI